MTNLSFLGGNAESTNDGKKAATTRNTGKVVASYELLFPTVVPGSVFAFVPTVPAATRRLRPLL